MYKNTQAGDYVIARCTFGKTMRGFVESVIDNIVLIRVNEDVVEAVDILNITSNIDALRRINALAKEYLKE